MFVSNHQPSKVLQPGKKSFNFPSTPIAPQFSAILSRRLFTIRAMRRNHFNSFFSKSLIERVTIICLVANQQIRNFFNKPFFERLLYQFDLMWVSTRDAYGDRKTSTVCHCHELRTLAPLGFPNTWAPFFAGAKLPSIKHSVKSSLPRSLRSRAKASSIVSMTPALSHSWKRRWQVWYGGYRSGKSFQGAPVRRTHSIASRISRDDLRGRPRLSSRAGITGICGSMTAHCSSLSSIAHLFFYPVSVI